MALQKCFDCSTPIRANEAYLVRGISLCRTCYHTAQTESHPPVTPPWSIPEFLERYPPPKGCTIIDDGMQITITATAYSIPRALMNFVIGIIWFIVIGVGVAFTLALTIEYFTGSTPTGIPTSTPGLAQGASPGSTPNNPSAAGSSVSLTMVFFMWLYLLTFLFAGITLVITFFTHLFGCCAVTIQGTNGTIFTGVGPIGWRRRFDASSVKHLQIGRKFGARMDWMQMCIIIVTQDNKKRRLANVVNNDRRAWMTEALRSVLIK